MALDHQSPADEIDAETYARARVANMAHFPDAAPTGRYRCFKCGQVWPCESALWAIRVIQRAAVRPIPSAKEGA